MVRMSSQRQGLGFDLEVHTFSSSPRLLEWFLYTYRETGHAKLPLGGCDGLVYCLVQFPDLTHYSPDVWDPVDCCDGKISHCSSPLVVEGTSTK